MSKTGHPKDCFDWLLLFTLAWKKKKTVQCFQKKKKKNEESFEIQILDYIDFTLSEEC